MAKRKEQQVAYDLFVIMCKTQKEIAETLDVTEKTVGEWVRKGNWRAERDARINGTKNQLQNIRNVISDLTENMLELIEQAKLAEARGDKNEATELKKQQLLISQQIANFNKALEKLDKESKFSLSTYIDIMEDIFQELKEYDQELFLKTIDFQKQHIQTMAQKLG